MIKSTIRAEDRANDILDVLNRQILLNDVKLDVIQKIFGNIDINTVKYRHDKSNAAFFPIGGYIEIKDIIVGVLQMNHTVTIPAVITQEKKKCLGIVYDTKINRTPFVPVDFSEWLNARFTNHTQNNDADVVYFNMCYCYILHTLTDTLYYAPISPDNFDLFNKKFQTKYEEQENKKIAERDKSLNEFWNILKKM